MNLNQVTIPCTDIHKSIEFYKKLGLKLIVHSHNEYARFLCPNGNSTFSLHKVASKTSNNTWVYFEVDDLAEKIANLKANKISIEEDIKQQPWLWTEARLKDPYGNQIIIYHAGENRINPPWRLKE
ncbi:MAG: VOC family protein [Bacteroidia bacterium]